MLGRIIMGSLTQTIHRNLHSARDAYDSKDMDVSVARQLSRDAHSLSSEYSTPKGMLSMAGWTEAGHNEEQLHYGANMFLRGGVDGVMISLITLTTADAAGWPLWFSCELSALLVACWCAYSAAREALEVVTYALHYKRERQREKWGNPPPPSLFA